MAGATGVAGAIGVGCGAGGAGSEAVEPAGDDGAQTSVAPGSGLPQ